MKLKKFILILVIPVGLAAWWGLANYNSSQEGLPPLHSEVADRGDIAQRVVAFGSLQPVQKVTVGSQVSGIIDDIYVDFNSPVRRGQLLARIDPQSFEAALSSAQAELESAEAGLELARLQ
jgi:HlyD family secretion protein